MAVSSMSSQKKTIRRLLASSTSNPLSSATQGQVYRMLILRKVLVGEKDATMERPVYVQLVSYAKTRGLRDDFDTDIDLQGELWQKFDHLVEYLAQAQFTLEDLANFLGMIADPAVQTKEFCDQAQALSTELRAICA